MSNHLDKINDKINKAQSIDELIPFIQAMNVGLDSMKNFLQNQVKELNQHQQRTTLYKSLPINDILSENIIQNITSFIHSFNVKFVNKLFKKCYDNNKKLFIQNRETEIIPKIETKHSKTFIVIKGPINLNDIITTKFSGSAKDVTIFTDLTEALKKCDNGDQILLFDGKYKIRHDFEKKVQIIGLDECAIVDIASNIFSTVYLKNLMLNIADSPGLKVKSDATLWMESCDIRYSTPAITIGETERKEKCTNASLIVSNCNFVFVYDGGIDEVCGIAINIWSDEGSFRILDCMFADNNCFPAPYPCIALRSKYVSDDFNITCVGNFFNENIGDPIGTNQKPYVWTEIDLNFNMNAVHPYKTNSYKYDDIIQHNDPLDEFLLYCRC
eukprot:24358_1